MLALLVGGISISKNFGNLSQSLELIKTLNANKEIIKASEIGFLPAALTYVGFNMIWLAAFCAKVGDEAENFNEARKGQILGAVGFSAAIFVMAIAIILSIGKLYNSQIPSLVLADEINRVFGTIFSLTIILGIYTSAVPLLWTPVARFRKEGTKEFKSLTIILGIAGMIVGLSIEFDLLVKYVYVINGYLGLILLAIMIYKSFKRKEIEK